MAAPIAKTSGTVRLENCPTLEAAFLMKVIVGGSVNGGDFRYFSVSQKPAGCVQFFWSPRHSPSTT